MNNNKVWFVTGASKGLGLALVRKLLKEGYRVAATSRSVNALQDAVQTEGDSFLPLAVNILDEADIKKAVDAAVTHFGSLDVLVNNAGYGLIGAVEELSDTEARNNFDVNVFGALNVIRQALPQMRKQQNGHIFNVSSIAGFSGGFAGFGIYCATKFAMHGFTESLSHEVKPFGIHTTLVMPGYFRTNFLNDSSLLTPKHEMDEYKNVRENQTVHQQQIADNQPGDPDKAADVLIEVAGMQTPPVHLFLGSDAYAIAEQKIALIQQDMQPHKALIESTGFESVVA